MTDPEWDYAMRMSPQFVVMDPQTRYRGTIAANADQPTMTANLRQIMAGDKPNP